jgi:hypothetical protein
VAFLLAARAALLAVFFNPLLNGKALAWHDHNRLPQQPARRQLQLLLCCWGIAYMDDVRKATWAIGIGGACPDTPDDFGRDILSVRL